MAKTQSELQKVLKETRKQGQQARKGFAKQRKGVKEITSKGMDVYKK